MIDLDDPIVIACGLQKREFVPLLHVKSIITTRGTSIRVRRIDLFVTVLVCVSPWYPFRKFALRPRF